MKRAMKRYQELQQAVQAYGEDAALELLCEKLKGTKHGAQSTIRWALDIDGKKMGGSRAQGLTSLALELLKQETEETLEEHRHEKLMEKRKKQTEQVKRDGIEKKRKKKEEELAKKRKEKELARKAKELANLQDKRIALETERARKELALEEAAGSSEGDSESSSWPTPAKSSSSPGKSLGSASPVGVVSTPLRAQFDSPVPSRAETGQQLTPHSWVDAVRIACNKGPFRGATCRAA